MSIDHQHPHITIRNSFSDQKEITCLTGEIHHLIKNEKNLSLRKISEINKLLRRGNINCLFQKNVLIGFLISYHLSPETIEISGLYIKPPFRNNGLSHHLINHVTNDQQYTYLAATFLEHIKINLEKLGFEEVHMNFLSFNEKCRFVHHRLKLHRVLEILRHKKKSKLFLLKK